MSDLKSERIIAYNECCNHCAGILDGMEIVVDSITAKDIGWQVEGTGVLDQKEMIEYSMPNVRCPYCAMMHNAIVHTIPIECETYHCPNCHSNESLNYDVKKVVVNGAAFTFEALINCTKCKNRGTLKTIISKLFDVIKVKIGPGGITVEKS